MDKSPPSEFTKEAQIHDELPCQVLYLIYTKILIIPGRRILTLLMILGSDSDLTLPGFINILSQ